MTTAVRSNVITFPGHDCRSVSGCPHCGTQTDFWRFGRLLWAYCGEHELRWVAADFGRPASHGADRARLRHNLEFLSAFDEVSAR